MMKRIAGILAISVIALQAFAGPAMALTSYSTNGFGDPYERPEDDDVDLAGGSCIGSETLELFMYYGELGCAAWYSESSETLLLSGVRQPVEVIAGGDLIIDLGDDGYSTNANFKGVALEIQVGGTLIFNSGQLNTYWDGDPDKAAKITMKQDGFDAVGFGLQNAKVYNAGTVQFYGTGYNDLFDASVLTVDITQRDDDPGIDGDAGNDILKGGSGADDIDGGSGKDTVYGNAGDDDTLTGGNDNDIVYGGAGDDVIDCDGKGDIEQCWGNEGDDAITIYTSGAGADVTVAPGDGADLLDFSTGNDAVTLYFGDMTKAHSITLDPVGKKGDCELSDFGEDTAEGDCSDVQTIIGTGFDDVFDVSAIDDNEGDDMVLSGGAGNDILVGPGGGDSIVLSGGSGNDKLFDGGADDSVALLGSTGNDRLVGASGGNYMSGGPGKDKVFAGAGEDAVIAGPGDDLAYGEAGADDLSMGRGNDLAFGGEDADTMAGAKGADRLSGGLGVDDVEGGAGNDQMHGDAGDDTLMGGPGYDRAWGDGDTYDEDPTMGDFCAAEVVSGCEWQLAIAPSGPYWVKLV